MDHFSDSTHIPGGKVHTVMTTFDVVYLETTSTPRGALFAWPVTLTNMQQKYVSHLFLQKKHGRYETRQCLLHFCTCLFIEIKGRNNYQSLLFTVTNVQQKSVSNLFLQKPLELALKVTKIPPNPVMVTA